MLGDSTGSLTVVHFSMSDPSLTAAGWSASLLIAFEVGGIHFDVVGSSEATEDVISGFVAVGVNSDNGRAGSG
jgi:hypothetical protein